MTQDILIFTDGASRGNPGPGGFGAIVISESEDVVMEVGGRETETTNNRMELLAVITALEKVGQTDKKVLVYTDSSYVLKGATSWMAGWKRNGWQTKTKTAVLNKDLWIRLDAALTGKVVEWKLVPGHAGLPLNERCDEIATAFADGKDANLYSGFAGAYEVSLEIKADNEMLAEKKEKKARSSAKAYSYVSSLGGLVMVHATWAECEARVKGKSGAKFKKVFSKAEETTLVKEWGKPV